MRKRNIVILGLVLLVLNAVVPVVLAAEPEKWTGVDESVVEKYAKENGREKRRSFIDTDQGDMLRLCF